MENGVLCEYKKYYEVIWKIKQIMQHVLKKYS